MREISLIRSYLFGSDLHCFGAGYGERLSVIRLGNEVFCLIVTGIHNRRDMRDLQSGRAMLVKRTCKRIRLKQE